jgi:predicted helicase
LQASDHASRPLPPFTYLRGEKLVCAFRSGAKAVKICHADAAMKQTIQDILEIFREDAANKRDLGDKFERLIAAYLTKDPFYGGLFGTNVWLWSEWPGRNNMGDTGVDIVAEEIATGDVWAVQCKFQDPDSYLQKDGVDKFLATSSKAVFKKRLFVSTTDKWGKNAEDALKNQQPPVMRMRVQDLDESAVDWSDFKINRPQDIKRKPTKKIRPHQKTALEKVIAGLKTAARGKLIMACGTGKTFTALKIAEDFVPAGGYVLFLVPSISLISQSFAEWSAQSGTPLNCFAVCSDPKAGKTDEEDISTHDLAVPAHTNAKILAKQIGQFAALKPKNLNVIFSTYQSIAQISKAQKEFGLPEFDLVICDEAHRTTGVEKLEMKADEASCFVSVHKEDFIRAKKRLYMTATPRIYTDTSKAKAKEAGVPYYSMDEEKDFGKELHRLDFSEAVRLGLLSDYKVLVLAVDQLHVNLALQQSFAKNKELTLDDTVKIVGCWNGLRKRFVKEAGDGSEAIDKSPMRRAVAFSSRIKDSEKVRELFTEIIKEYTGEDDTADGGNPDFLKTEVHHVDGKMNALVRSRELQWLKADTAPDGNVCRILSNARCLSEGVDVPALDAVMFLNPRKSVVDVVQSVGRVMRKVDGKQYGYIILPIGVPAGVPPDEALDNYENYKVVWQVLQALRAHDTRLDDEINKIDLNKERTDKIQIIGVGGDGKPGENTLHDVPVQAALNFNLHDWENAIFAKIVVKCGSRKYWEQWAQDVAKIAETHVTRIKALLAGSDASYRKQFDKFLNGLRKTLNPSISEDDAIEMLSQHLITKPVFDALFEGYEFTKHNPVSKTMQKMLDVLDEQSLEKERESLEGFYENVREKARNIDNAEGRQKVIVELYEKFFKTAFPRMAERLGIVYTPVEVVDFMLKSVDDILKDEFGVGLTAENVHILDPFTGTGTYIVRLIQSGIIDDHDLARKFRGELHANEIVLLAYYIAAINIEEAYHGRVKKDYEPFEGIVLTDTFQLSEGEGKFTDESFQTNSKRALAQKNRDIRVIVGNPPYKKGQESQNDNNENLKYPRLDKRIEHTYAEQSASSNINSLYDSYIRAIRWASDRVKDKGIICYVSNGGFIDSNAMSGLRKCLSNEFAAIYVFNLRGNIRAFNREEGQNIFGQNSMALISISIFIKNSEKKGGCQLFYHDIGDCLKRDEKLKIITDFQSVKKIPWSKITPNINHDWINQRNEAFEKFMPLGLKEEKGSEDVEAAFVMYSRGVATCRDAWAYNYSAKKLEQNMGGMIERFNQQVEGYKKVSAKGGKVKDFIETDAKKINWSGNLITDVERGRTASFSKGFFRTAQYRPFTRSNFYFDRQFNERVYRLPIIFPEATTDNLAICVCGIRARATNEFSVLMVDRLPDLEFHAVCQCFPLRYYDAPKKTDEKQGDFHSAQDGWRENVSEFSLKEFRAAYGDAKIQKEDIFYYVYGILHSPEYKTRFAADLKKMLPRIPFAEVFWPFSQAGRDLAKIHLNYETAQPYPVTELRAELGLDDEKTYLVEKMRFGKTQRTATTAAEVDKGTIIYNSRITLTGIPPAAYEYIVNGKPALEWIMDRYQLSTDKDSGITNDPNDWPREHNDPQYILNLVKRIITVSVETMKIVNALPSLNERKG